MHLAFVMVAVVQGAALQALPASVAGSGNKLDPTVPPQGCGSNWRHATAVTRHPAVCSRTASTVALKPCEEWELDFYSRPVQGADGKKLWELLVTDRTGSFRHVESVPSNCVNSGELRLRVQRLINEAALRPTTIRFFRVQMKNMITIALSELPGVTAKASRITYTLYDWLHEREASVYPAMPGYRKPRPEVVPLKIPVKLPEQLRGEQYAVATLPFAEFAEGGSISDDNIGFGSLCPLPSIPISPDVMVPGIVIFSRRSRAIAAWLTGIDLAFVVGSLESREFLLEVGLDTQYLLARMRTGFQVTEAEAFEANKRMTRGLHFLSVQPGPEAEQPDGFWLLKDTEVPIA